jgi:hypothetical protein
MSWEADVWLVDERTASFYWTQRFVTVFGITSWNQSSSSHTTYFQSIVPDILGMCLPAVSAHFGLKAKYSYLRTFNDRWAYVSSISSSLVCLNWTWVMLRLWNSHKRGVNAAGNHEVASLTHSVIGGNCLALTVLYNRTALVLETVHFVLVSSNTVFCVTHNSRELWSKVH